MKKILCFVTSVAMCGLFVVGAHAAEGITADEQKIIDALKQGVEVDGAIVSVPAEYMNQAEAFLSTNDVTADQASQILAEVEAVKAIVKENNIKSLDELEKNSALVSKIFAHAQKAASVVGVTLSIENGVVVGMKDGKVVFKSDAVDNTIKNTGDDYTIMMVMTAAVAIVLAGAGVVASKKGYFAK